MNLHSKIEEDFSLLILWHIIIKYKLMIFVMVILSTSIATFYSYNLKNQYKVSATIHQDYFNLQILDPTIAIFPYNSEEVIKYSENEVKDIFLSDLNLDKYKNRFFIKEHLNDNKINLHKEISVKKSDSLSRNDNIWLMHENVDFAKKLLNDYILFSEKEMIKELSSNIEKSIVNKLFKMEKQLHTLENMIQNNIDIVLVPAPAPVGLNKRYCAKVNCSDKVLNDLRFSILALKKIKINKDLINIVKSVSYQVKVKDARGGLIVTLGIIFSILFGIVASFFLNFINTQSEKYKVSTNLSEENEAR